MKPYMRRYFAVASLVLLCVLMPAAATSLTKVFANEHYKIMVTYIIKGNITNLSNEKIYINETDLLLFDYPMNTSDQKLLYYEVIVNNTLVTSDHIKIEYGDEPRIIVDAGILEKEYIKPGETISARARYIVMVDMNIRRRVLKDLGRVAAGGWDEIKVSDEIEISETELWNFSNPLIKLLVKYISSRIERDTPFHYMLSCIRWIIYNVNYSTRVPPRQPWEVVAFRHGDCDDMSNLLITLLRARGIPSYLEYGVVFVSERMRISGEAASGLFKYTFIGGGSHAWAAAYIPPWGYLRIDLTFGDLDPLSHIMDAAYYNYPTIVLGRVRSGDYSVESVKFLNELREKMLLYQIVIIVKA